MILTDVGSQINLLPREKLIFRKLCFPLWQYCETLYVFFRNRTPFYSLHESLPPATKFGQGYVFTRVCDSVHRGSGIPACLAGLQEHTQGEVEGSGLGGLQAHTQGGEVEGSGLGGLQAHTWGVFRLTPGGVSRSTAWGGLQAHT